MVKFVISGVELDVPPDTSIDIGFDEDGDLKVFVDEVEDPTGYTFPPGPITPPMTLIDVIMSPNQFLAEMELIDAPKQPQTYMGIDLSNGEDETVCALVSEGTWKSLFKSARAEADKAEEKATLLGPEPTDEHKLLQDEANKLYLQVEIARMKRELRELGVAAKPELGVAAKPELSCRERSEETLLNAIRLRMREWDQDTADHHIRTVQEKGNHTVVFGLTQQHFPVQA